MVRTKFAIFAMFLSVSCVTQQEQPQEVELSEQNITICSPDLLAKEWFQNYYGASNAEMHWFTQGQYWQIGGNAWNQPVEARAYFLSSVSGTRTVDMQNCNPSYCSHYWYYKCTCSSCSWLSY